MQFSPTVPVVELVQASHIGSVGVSGRSGVAGAGFGARAAELDAGAEAACNDMLASASRNPSVCGVSVSYSSMTMHKCPEGAFSKGIVVDPGGSIIWIGPGPGKCNFLPSQSSIARWASSVRNPSSPGKFTCTFHDWSRDLV